MFCEHLYIFLKKKHVVTLAMLFNTADKVLIACVHKSGYLFRLTFSGWTFTWVCVGVCVFDVDPHVANTRL